jgi:hypothetical protein
MSVRIDVRQIRTTETGPLYRVTTMVTYVTGIDRNVFVYDTTTEEFSHVAAVWDIETYPTSRSAAQEAELSYYRQSTATVDYTTVAVASAAAAYTLARIDSLAQLYTTTQDDFEGSDDHTYPSPEA